jgi:hypothetical protein
MTVRLKCIMSERRRKRESNGHRSNDEINITVEHLQQRQDLVDRLAVVRLIEQAIELRCRSPDATNDLAFG